MRQTLQDQERLCGVDEALQALGKRHPAVLDIATSYARLMKARQEVLAALPHSSLLGTAPSAEPLTEDLPLLAGLFDSLAHPEPEVLARFRIAARRMLPALALAFPAMAKDLASVALRLEGAPAHQADHTAHADADLWGDALASALLAAIGPGQEEEDDAEENSAEKNGPAQAPRSMEELAQALEVQPSALHLATVESLLAVLTHEAALLIGLVDQDAWRQSYCPVCGGGPDVGILKEGKEDSEFLIAKAGQLWLHCGQCTALWRHQRLRCVACGCEDPGRMELLLAEDDPRAEHERAHLCQECQTYFTTVNLVDRSERVNLEMLPMSLLHLELLAQERGFSPLAPSPWNTLD